MKRPSFQFYPGDWLNDVALRMVSVGARGMWIEMICLMHQGSEYGFLKVAGKVILPSNLSRMIGATLPETEGWLKELLDAGVYSIDDGGCIFSRRMIRDEEIRQARARGGIKGGNPNLLGKKKPEQKVNLPGNLPPTPSSSSSSSSSKPKPPKPPKGPADDRFDQFWQAYPKKVGKAAALKAWEKAKPDLQAVLKALEWQKQSDQWRKDGGQYIPNPATWLNQGRWDDAPVEAGQVISKQKPWYIGGWSEIVAKGKEAGIVESRDLYGPILKAAIMRHYGITLEMETKAQRDWNQQ